MLWSADPNFVDDEGRVLNTTEFEKLSIANPKLAPYGEASIETLKALSLKEAIEPKLVMGENIAQAYQFVDTGNAKLGFVALSQVMVDGKITKGSGWIVPGDMHAPIRQDAVILKRFDILARFQSFPDYRRCPAYHVAVSVQILPGCEAIF